MTQHNRVQHIGKLTILQDSIVNQVRRVDFTIFEEKPEFSESGDDIVSWKVRKCRASDLIAQKIVEFADASLKVAVEGFLIDESIFHEGDFHTIKLLLTDRVYSLEPIQG